MQECNSDKLIATSMNQEEWDKFGLSWIGSLLKYQNYKILIIDKGLNDRTLNFLLEIQAVVIKSNDNNLDAIIKMADYSFANKCSCSYWKCNCYFQSEVNSLFNCEKLLFSSETESGLKTGKLNFVYGKPNHLFI